MLNSWLSVVELRCEIKLCSAYRPLFTNVHEYDVIITSFTTELHFWITDGTRPTESKNFYDATRPKPTSADLWMLPTHAHIWFTLLTAVVIVVFVTIALVSAQRHRAKHRVTYPQWSARIQWRRPLWNHTVVEYRHSTLQSKQTPTPGRWQIQTAHN